MIKEVELRNWKTHADTKLVFQPGVNVLIGIMGAGKSSVIEAMSFALFGTFPSLKQRRVKLEDMIKSRPSKERESEVRLTFVVGKDSYTVTRRLSSNGATTAKLDKNGGYLQAQPIRVNEEIESLLKIDYDTFARAVYSEQNGLEYFLGIAKSERKKQIDGMLGLDQFAGAEENCTSLINNIKTMISGEETILGTMDVAALRKQLDKQVSEKDRSLKELSSLKEREVAERAALTKIDAKIREQKELYTKKEGLSRQLVEYRGKTQVIEEEIAKINSMLKGLMEESVRRELDEFVKKEAQLNGLIEESEKGYKKVTKEVSDLESSLNSEKKRLKEKNILVAQIGGRSAKQLEKRAEDEAAALGKLTDAQAQNRNRLEEIENSVTELQKHLAKCPVCERELGRELSEKLIEGKRSITKEIKKELERLEGLVADRKKAKREADDEVKEVLLAEDKMKGYSGVEESLKKAEALLQAKEKELEGINATVDAKRKERDSLKERMQKARASAELFNKKAEHDAAIRRYRALLDNSERELSKIRIDDKEMSETQGSFAKQSEQLGSTVAMVSNTEKQLTALDASIIDLVKQVDSLKGIEQRLELRKKTLRSLNGFKIALAETAAFLRSRLIQSINNLMQGIWPELYPYMDYTKLRLDARPDDYMLEAYLQNGTEGAWASVDSTASGGERSIACLALRISLSMVIVPNLKWLILDEPTHNIDSEGISKLIGVLGDALPKVVDQVFIVTHDENLKQITSAKVYQLDRDKGSAGSTIASEI
ncbi:MAG TPA: AAA family ATPase [Candidatus Acidoferrum sp.]|nr:AAA family ATPase [Candidatus Acidoferrum sp.]